jgi:hypothetical protein
MTSRSLAGRPTVRLFNFVLPALIAAGAAIPTIPTVKPGGPPTTGIVAAADGTVYFVDSFHQTVWRVATNGEKTPFVTGRNGRSLQIDEDGFIYGTHEEEKGQLILWRADPSGNVRSPSAPASPSITDGTECSRARSQARSSSERRRRGSSFAERGIEVSTITLPLSTPLRRT